MFNKVVWKKKKRSRSKSNFYALIGQNLTGEFMRKISAAMETCLLIAEADRVLCYLLMFLKSFSTGCTKWNTTAIKILLYFMAGLFIAVLVERCTACQSHWKSDFGWHRFQKWAYSLALVRGVRGLKSIKRFWPHLMAFRSSISTQLSTGNPEQLLSL